MVREHDPIVEISIRESLAVKQALLDDQRRQSLIARVGRLCVSALRQGHRLAKTDARYYCRPHKTILVRTVADGGESYYFCGEHRATLPALRRALPEVK